MEARRGQEHNLLDIGALVEQSAHIPAQLRSRPIWLAWRYETVKDRQTKVPYNVRTGGRASSTEPSTWTDFDTAVRALQGGGYSGLGIGISGDIAAIDIDHCIDRYGNLSELAQSIVDAMDSYTELSPSGTGVRILFTAPGFVYDRQRYYINNQRAGLEVYIAGCTNKYVTITGKVLRDVPIQERSAAVAGVLEAHMLRPVKPKVERPAMPAFTPAVNASPNYTLRPNTTILSDTDVIRKAESASNCVEFATLWSGQFGNCRSHSDADLALCNHLAFWTRGDAVQMDRLFRQSGLYREKWDRADYRNVTIQKAIADCGAFYDPQYNVASTLITAAPAPDSKAARPPGISASSPAALHYTGNDLPAYEPTDYTDAGNSKVFAAFVAGRLIWTESYGFLFWNGMMWDANPTAATGLGKLLTERMLKEARTRLYQIRLKKTMLQTDGTQADGAKANADLKAVEEEEKHAEAYRAFVLKSRAKQRIDALVMLSKPDILVASDKLNADPFLLNTPAGMVDLRTGVARPHDPMEYCTAITSVSPSIDGGELWWEHLRMVTDDSPDLIRFHQEAAGMALIGRVYMENLQLAVGDGSNGKSTLYNVQAMVLGPGYAGTINPEVLTTDKRNAGADLATLKGKRLIIAAELEEGKRLSTSILKRLTSTDPITAERKYCDPETFIPTHSTVLYTNFVPRLGSLDNGTKRRLKIVPFDARIPVSTERKNFTQTIYEQAGGAVLQWMIEGTQMFIRNGYTLSPCAEVTEATQKYFADNDWITPFLEECCIVEPDRKCAGSALYQAYAARAESEGEYVRRNNDFAREMEKLGFQKIRQKTGVVWYGIGLRGDWKSGQFYSPGMSF